MLKKVVNNFIKSIISGYDHYFKFLISKTQISSSHALLEKLSVCHYGIVCGIIIELGESYVCFLKSSDDLECMEYFFNLKWCLLKLDDDIMESPITISIYYPNFSFVPFQSNRYFNLLVINKIPINLYTNYNHITGLFEIAFVSFSVGYRVKPFNLFEKYIKSVYFQKDETCRQERYDFFEFSERLKYFYSLGLRFFCGFLLLTENYALEVYNFMQYKLSSNVLIHFAFTHFNHKEKKLYYWLVVGKDFEMSINGFFCNKEVDVLDFITENMSYAPLKEWDFDKRGDSGFNCDYAKLSYYVGIYTDNIEIFTELYSDFIGISYSFPNSISISGHTSFPSSELIYYENLGCKGVLLRESYTYKALRARYGIEFPRDMFIFYKRRLPFYVPRANRLSYLTPNIYSPDTIYFT